MTLLRFILLSSVISQEGQVIIVRVLLVKIVENKEVQIIPIRGITIFPLIIKIYLTYT